MTCCNLKITLIIIIIINITNNTNNKMMKSCPYLGSCLFEKKQIVVFPLLGKVGINNCRTSKAYQRTLHRLLEAFYSAKHSFPAKMHLSLLYGGNVFSVSILHMEYYHAPYLRHRAVLIMWTFQLFAQKSIKLQKGY